MMTAQMPLIYSSSLDLLALFFLFVSSFCFLTHLNSSLICSLHYPLVCSIGIWFHLLELSFLTQGRGCLLLLCLPGDFLLEILIDPAHEILSLIYV